ncbi:hypothetical protein [Halorussus salinisoli]|uniref:hypothetical protein n=1 Tax=Halorussus salinisoli TaxID=2558242 RepID=UPI0010C18425|nr:hypothetical protein [Halorussus salinisoli]
MVDFSGDWLTAIDIAISAILSAALVALYFKQTRILESQRELLTQELNREARQQHTETLRERVRLWHGNPDRETGETPIDGPDMNLPGVAGASFKTAPVGSYAVTPLDEEEFEIIPSQLQGDRYLQDLLNNHAPDLREAKEEIERLHHRFVSLREEFREEYDESEIVEKEEYKLEPADFFSRWVFEQIVLLGRDRYDGLEDLQDVAISRLEKGDSGVHSDEPLIWIRVDRGGGSSFAIYSASIDDYNREELNELRSSAEEDTKELVEQALTKIDKEHPYSLAYEAAEVLDDAKEAIEELERILMEYEGRPIYTGDCKYLDEAKI